jgi:hypothetical protein
MEAYQERVITERDVLADKLGNLQVFVNSAVFLNISRSEQVRLVRQLLIMSEYQNILDERISAFGAKHASA